MFVSQKKKSIKLAAKLLQKKLEEEEQNKPKLSTWKEIIK